jgi:hypothetical protein
MKHKALVLLCCFAAVLSGCITIPKQALTLNETSLSDRQMQSRKYEINDETKILSACAGLMQGMGFSLDESETDLGVIVGSKERSAVDAGQQVAALIVALLVGVPMPTDDTQKMRCCIVTHPSGGSHIVVRVCFQRIVWDSTGNITTREGIKDPEVYQEFFDKLSKAIFLEGQSL